MRASLVARTTWRAFGSKCATNPEPPETVDAAETAAVLDEVESSSPHEAAMNPRVATAARTYL